MWKKTLSALLSLPLIFVLSTCVFAEETNVLSDYTGLDWRGDMLYFDKESGSLYFQRSDGKSTQESTVTIDIEQGSTGFLFYVDAGNGNDYRDSGYCTIKFYDENGAMLFDKSTGLVSKSENYIRHSLGENEKFYPLPEGAATAEIRLHIDENSSGERVNVYFRNFSLFFSKDMPLCEEDSSPLMKNSASLSKVEVGLTPYTHWIWVGIVLLVALAFYLIRIWRQKYSVSMLNKKK